MFRLAVVADPHVHNVHMPYAGMPLGLPTVRTLADTVESTRVFNEGFMAFRATLDDIGARGLKHVVIVGDMTDDGQISAWRAFTAITEEYAARYGLRFYTTPGNHDLFGMDGRDNSKRILREDGSHFLLTSDRSLAAEHDKVVTPQMLCPGYPQALQLGRSLGYFGRPEDLHWETPFGTTPDLETRTYLSPSADGAIELPMVDASYLVEPEAGLWLLSLDANVYLPERSADGSIRVVDQSDAGWNAAVKHKPHLLAWATDVARRARELRKTLICFSHYPVVDPLAGNHHDELTLLGQTSFARRVPSAEVSQAFSGAGIRVHFSGHWHINNTARFAEGGVVNVAVPAAVAFPSAYKVVAAERATFQVSTIPVADVPGHDLAYPLYDLEIARTGADFGDITASRNQAQFLDRHLEQMVIHRYLPREWPPDLAALVPAMTVATLADLASIDDPLSTDGWSPRPDDEQGRGPSMLQLITDWYRLRKGGQLALEFIGARNLESYRAIAGRFAAGRWPDGSLQARLQTFLRMFERYDLAAPSVDFTIDLDTGRIHDDLPAVADLTELRQTGIG